MRENKEQMREISGVTVDNSVRAVVTVPQGRCSQECRRRYVWCRPRTCPPCTSQSLLSLCGPRCRAAHYPALDPWEGRNATQVWITLIDTIFITVISYKRHDKSVSCLCRTQTEVNTGKPGHVMKQPTSLPVDDAFAVEEEEADRYLCRIKPGGRRRDRESANSKEDDDKRLGEREWRWRGWWKGEATKEMKGRKMKKERWKWATGQKFVLDDWSKIID